MIFFAILTQERSEKKKRMTNPSVSQVLNIIILLIGLVYNIDICLCQVQIPEDVEGQLINIGDNFVNDDLLGDLEGSPLKTNAFNKDFLNDIYKLNDKYFFVRTRSKRDTITSGYKSKIRPSPLLH